MRTTITLDADVERLLRNTMRERDLTFKEAVNHAIRMGLKGSRAKQKRFRQQTFPLGANPALQWDKALKMAAALEDEELIRKMASGK